MPLGNIGTYACRNLQGKLVDYFGKNISALRTLGSLGLMKWLLSPQNTAGFRKISDDIKGVPGKRRGVAFQVEDPFCYALCALNVACDANNIQYVDAIDREIVFDLTNAPFRHCDDQGRPVRLRFREDDLEKFCTETNTEYIENKIARYLLRFEESLDASVTTLLSANIGHNGADEAITNIPLFTSSNQYTPGMAVYNPEAAWRLQNLYKDLGLVGQFALIGGTIVDKVALYQKWATANDAGIDMTKLDAVNPFPFYDRNFNTTFGQQDMIMLAPGAVQLVTWNKYRGERVRGVKDLYSKGTITLPTTGLEVDWKWWYDYECEAWTFEAFLHAELAAVPPGGCGANLANVNGIVRIHDCGVAPLFPACPEVIEP